MKRIKLALLGAGARGKDVYGDYVLKHPHEAEFVAVADIDPLRREAFANAHKISKDMTFSSWENFLAKPQLCDAVIIATQDRMHYEPTIAALEKGYNVLLEKPMSNQPKECLLMVKKSEHTERLLTVCHVLRYTPFFSSLKAIIDEGRVGKVISIQHIEKVGYWHQAHSFVRGNWRSSEESSPMILQKCCHDMDILSWLTGKKCIKLSSFGSLSFFRPENAPKGSTEKCTDGCAVESTCPYSALRIYVGKEGWPSNVVSADTSRDGMIKALETGPYGRCVFRCDNNVVDHQVVNMEFEDGITVSFTMCAFTKETSRSIHIMGTDGEIHGNMESNTIEVYNFSSSVREVLHIPSEGGHSGGDGGLMRSFIDLLQSKEGTPSLTSAASSMQSHMMAFAAEKARLENKVIHMEDFIGEILA